MYIASDCGEENWSMIFLEVTWSFSSTWQGFRMKCAWESTLWAWEPRPVRTLHCAHIFEFDVESTITNRHPHSNNSQSIAWPNTEPFERTSKLKSKSKAEVQPHVYHQPHHYQSTSYPQPHLAPDYLTQTPRPPSPSPFHSNFQSVIIAMSIVHLSIHLPSPAIYP